MFDNFVQNFQKNDVLKRVILVHFEEDFTIFTNEISLVVIRLLLRQESEKLLAYISFSTLV